MHLTLRTLQRWTRDGALRADARTTTARPTPANALSREERAEILALCNRPEHAHLPPSQIVPRLADQGRYVAPELTFYRVLRAADQQHRRGRSQPPQRRAAPTTHVATAARQVWSWDITYLPSPVRGQYYYLYLIEDIYSRKAVGWEVYEQECGERAATLWPQCAARVVPAPAVGAALGQWLADEIGHAVEQDARPGRDALAGTAQGEQ